MWIDLIGLKMGSRDRLFVVRGASAFLTIFNFVVQFLRYFVRNRGNYLFEDCTGCKFIGECWR